MIYAYCLAVLALGVGLIGWGTMAGPGMWVLNLIGGILVGHALVLGAMEAGRR